MLSRLFASQFRIVLAALLLSQFIGTCHADSWLVGLAKQDITPMQPLRLSGYASRTESSAGVADPLHVRAVAISPGDPKKFVDSIVLVSVDSVAVTNAITQEVATWLEGQHGIPRSQLVISSTHSHAAPQLGSGLLNLFREESTSEQVESAREYTASLVARMKHTIATAIESRVEADVAIGDSTANFAVNRRVISNGAWSGFGVQVDGLTDNRVRVMRFSTPNGKLLGASFIYACHCTTLGPSFNAISGDWAGLAASRLEQLHDAAVFLPIIGCGADANPNPRDSYPFAQQHAAAMVDSVQIAISKELTELTVFPVAKFGFAGLVPERPTDERVKELSQSQTPNERRWAKHMLDVKQRMGRLPESYPMPIHTWQFGEQLTWVFLGGEVVADYQFKIEEQCDSSQTWVAAYSDDVFAYVASENMLTEGGYEVDGSMIYYLQPGRWESGTQALILRRVSEILKQERSDDKALSASEALAALRVPDGYRVELVASDPLIQDPINIAFGMDGRVWLVEMADYPLGTAGGGRIKWLRDNDLDGTLDEAHVFLDGLSYPTSVMPWRDGVLVIAAPDIIYAEDFNGDGVADRRETLVTGIGEANPQHRASGFEIGLDGWLHFGSGDQTRELHSLRNGQTYEVEGHDVAWQPDTGEIRTTTGETQFVRARDAFGNWFGNSNSYPMYQYVIDQRYLVHASVSGGSKQHLLEPAAAPAVHPRSRTVDRFNDQFARERFTSACSSIVARVPGIMSPAERAAGTKIGFICEPVHNLVARISIDNSRAAMSAVRHPGDGEFDFLTSTDLWSRPVRVVNAPDGTIWVLDMVRRVIEHPQWIPSAWQERLDLRSGAHLGRIYRIFLQDFQPTPLQGFGNTAADLLPRLASDNGVIRDLALQAICATELPDLEASVRQIAQTHPSASVRVSALGCLQAKGWLNPDDVIAALNGSDGQLVRYALTLAEKLPSSNQGVATALNTVVQKRHGSQVDLQWVLSSTLLAQFDASAGLKVIADRSPNDVWIGKALTLVIGEKESLAALNSILAGIDRYAWDKPHNLDSYRAPLQRLWQRCSHEAQAILRKSRVDELLAREAFLPGDVLLLAAWAKSNAGTAAQFPPQLQQKLQQRLLNPEVLSQERLALASLLGTGILATEADLDSLEVILAEENSSPIKVEAIARSAQLKSNKVPSVLLRHWMHLTSTERNAVCTSLLQAGNEWTSQLVQELEAESIKPRELEPSVVQQLRSLEDKTLRSRVETVLGQPTARAPLVARYLQELKLTGESNSEASKAAGARLFAEQCSVCHRPKDGTPALGPSIENLGHWTNEQWVTAVIDPNQTVEPKFQQSTILTTSGQVFTGIVVERSSQMLRMATTDGKTQEVPSDEVEELKKSSVSLMPEGIEEKLTPQQLGEIISFLRGR
jgi:putative membrane-bound dehydrogenase-like protein